MSTLNSTIISNTCQYNEQFMVSHNSSTQEISLMQKHTQMKKNQFKAWLIQLLWKHRESLQTILEFFYQKQIHL